ncbi:6841_t:CDS:2 [Cetraspora pellucida]|uniref:6841_t:CDS:1 n=1 Tax=Cetraspora pellucida TaxID=1433469 RepID=A0A9N8Z5X1_9GLOM|nr:6841_t:CDS:2 [Cetraspora pellucida]
MPQIHTLLNIDECQKLRSIPSNRYPPSRTELENQLVCTNQDQEIAIDSSYEDVSKIICRYTDDIKNALIVINSYLYKGEFIVFDLDRPEDDPLAIWLRFDTLLDLQKEIEL